MGAINCKEYGKTEDETNGTHVHKCDTTTTDPAETYIGKTCEEMEDYIEKIVCNAADINDNEMKQLDFEDDSKILLIKQNGKLSAIGNKCSHYGAPLHTGALGQGRVRCPWHGACFNIETGDIEDFPGQDSLPCYRVQVEHDGKVKVRAKRRDLNKNKRTKDMVKRDPTDERVFIVVGGGPSGGICAETLRQEGFTGRIVMVCKENALPYDRVKVSKSMDADLQSIQYRNTEFYDEYSIETMLGVEATKLDTVAKILSCSNGYAIKYDKIYIATGSTAIKAPIPGAQLRNILTMRDHTDAQAVLALINKDANVVCLGSSFVSLEAASYCVKKVKSVTVICRENVPFKASFGEEIGQRVLTLFEDNKITMTVNSGITECIGEDGKVTSVKLKDGSVIPCDVLIMGTGSRLNTEFVRGSGVSVNPNGSIDTDMHLMTNVPDVFVGGDIANAPVFSIANQKATIGHYPLAQYHGRVAAINIAGCKVEELKAVPVFWTMLFGKGFRYSGHGKHSEVKIEGSLDDLKFVAFFLDEHGYVISMASCGRDPVVAQFAELQSQGRRLHKNDLNEDAFAWTKLIEKPKSC